MKQGLKVVLGALALLLATATAGGDGASAQSREPSASQTAARPPLIVEGKKKLYQRVIARPEATLFASAVEQGGVAVQPFSIFYVYGREGGFVEVGKTLGAADGFMREDKLIDWKQAIVAMFSNPANRERSLLFDKRESLEAVVNDPDARGRLAALRTAADNGSRDGTVVAIEPALPPDNLYFLPILSVANARLGQRITGRILKVASLSKEDARSGGLPPPKSSSPVEVKIGIVFVVDTTMSMGPYIARVQQAMMQLQSELAQSRHGSRTRFGLIGFRQSLKDNGPGIEYDVKTFLRLNEEATANAFLQQIDQMKESPVSTKGFNEDSLGGVYHAITDSDWRGFDEKFIVLITDAGPQLPTSGRNLFAPGLGVGQIRDKALSDGITLLAWHLTTPEGAADHDSARAWYGDLTLKENKTAYFEVKQGGIDGFMESLEDLRKALISDIEKAERRILAGDRTPPAPMGNAVRDAIARNFYAMYMTYLGRVTEARPPAMFEAFLADRDLSDPSKASTDIRVLLTKNELTTMREAVGRIVVSAENAIIDPTSFFAQLQLAIARVVRDASRQESPPVQVDTVGVELDDLLAGLPYQSPTLSIDNAQWLRMGAGRQNQMRVELDAKLAFANDWHNTPARWVALKEGVPDGETVTLYPLSQLP